MTTRQPGESLRDFMSRDPRGGTRQNYLKWKDRPDHAATVWLHPQASILGLWRHPFQKIYVREDKATNVTTKEVSYDPLLCWEAPEVNESQNWRDRETGRREKPPVVCPICLMVEHLHALVADRKLDWRTPLFRFEGTDPSKTKVYHVGGVTGLFNNRKLSDAQKMELGGNLPDGTPDPKWPPARWLGPIYLNRAFMQDIRPGLEYVFTIVDNDDVGKGVQVTFEKKSIGDKTLEVNLKSIKEARTPSDPEGRAGDILVSPYAIRWEYNDQASEPSKIYDAMKMGRTPMTPAIQRLFQSPPPDVSKHAERFNLKTIRARLEQHLILPGLKQHLDKYFERALKLEAEQKANPPPAAEPRVPEVETRVPENTGTMADYSQQAVTDDLFACDTVGCDAELRATDAQCPKCKRRYEVVGEPPPPPKPALKPRSAAGMPGVSAPPLPPGLAASPEMSGGDPLGLSPESQGLDAPDLGEGTAVGSTAWPGDPDSDIPF